jgi:hypothetical protein
VRAGRFSKCSLTKSRASRVDELHIQRDRHFVATKTPPDFSALFHTTPKSLRLTFSEAETPMSRCNQGSSKGSLTSPTLNVTDLVTPRIVRCAFGTCAQVRFPFPQLMQQIAVYR